VRRRWIYGVAGGGSAPVWNSCFPDLPGFDRYRLFPERNIRKIQRANASAGRCRACSANDRDPGTEQFHQRNHHASDTKTMTRTTFLLCLLFTACDAVNGPADLQVLRESRPVGSSKELSVDLKYDVGQLEITRAAEDTLFSLDLQYDRRRYDPK